MCDNELFEKVEKGTDICISSTGGCLKCPYVPFYPGSCSYYCSVDTLALIRSQQARIKEFEAAQERKAEHEAKVITLDGLSNYRGPVWMLEKTSSGMVGHWRKPFSGFDTEIYACFEEECYLVEEYGKTWLPWTKKPTNERIKAVKWNETD